MDRLRNHVLKSINAPIVVIDETNEIQYSNPKWDKYLKDEQNDTDNYLQLIKTVLWDEIDVQEQIESVTTGQVDESKEVYPLHSPDNRQWIEIICRNVPSEDSDDDLYVIIHHDITERIKLKKKIVRLKSTVSSQFGFISHELRNKISNIKGHLEFIEKEVADERPTLIDKHVIPIEQSVENIIEVANTPDDWGTNSGELKYLTVSRVLAQIIEEQPQIKRDWITVSSDREFVGRENEIKHLFLNIILNSIEHSDSEIEITIEDTDSGISISDTGSGFPEDEDIEKIGYTTKETGSASGYGTHIITTLAHTHNWDVIFSNTDSGAQVELIME